MTDKVAVLIVNYNMPERTNALVESLMRSGHPHDIIVIDNGSDIVGSSKYTTLQLEHNIQTTGGWLAGLDSLEQRYFAYMFLITSAEIPNQDNDIIGTLASTLKDDKQAVGVHPALTADSTTAWNHLITTGKSGIRKTWMIDNIASMYMADWFDDIGRFDPDLIYGWGIDLETSWKAREQRRTLWINEDVYVKKITDIGYDMNRMNMSAQKRRQVASDNMRDVLSRKYGDLWWLKMTEEYRVDYE
jgi:hypothetical protein